MPRTDAPRKDAKPATKARSTPRHEKKQDKSASPAHSSKGLARGGKNSSVSQQQTGTADAAQRVVLPGSERSAFGQQPAEVKRRGAGRRITVSVLVRRRAPLPSVSATTDGVQAPSARVSRAQFRQQFGADPVVVKAVRNFAAQFGLEFGATADQLAGRTVQLSGSRAQMEAAFGVSLQEREADGKIYRVREGNIEIPAELAGSVEAVLGLDDRPQARAHFRVATRGRAGRVRPRAADSDGYTPPQIAGFYDFPKNVSAAGQTIGLIELGGGYRAADLKAYFGSLGLAVPKVTTVSVDGGKNAPSTADGADGEVMLDIEVAAAVAPGAAVAVYFAPNTDQGFIDAVTTAVHDTTNKPSVISISWGGPESSWTAQAVSALDSACQAAAALGISITVAAGDSGSSDGVSDGGNHVDFPASSPHVLACGGTKIEVSGSALTGEVVWNEEASQEGATGGGVSTLFAKPAWQSAANVPAPPSGSTGGGRGVPDVAADADPTTGYTIRVDGETIPIGGTSAVAPLWAGLIALSNAQNKKTAGFANAVLYGATGAFRDITEGNNGAYSAGPGWDPCTGLGSPVGTGVVAALGGAAPTSGGGAPTGGSGSGTGTPGKKHHKKHR